MRYNHLRSSYFEGPWRGLSTKRANVAKWRSISSGVNLFDLGSAGGTPPPFCWIPEWVTVVNFEPDPRSNSTSDKKTFPIAIGPAELNRIYLNKRPTTSSLLRPYKKVIERYNFGHIFPNDSNIFETVSIQNVKTYGLDEVVSLKKLPLPDFLKIDVQGLSFEVLESAKKCLADSTIGIQIEVEFLETYEGQKTFGVVHEFLYDLGFEIFRLSNINKWYYKTGIKVKKVTGQDVFCDLLYFRSIDSIEEKSHFWTQERVLKAVLLFLLYDLNDSGAAFFEKFLSCRFLSEENSQVLKGLISNWKSAFDFFYGNKKSFIDKAFDISPRKIIRFFKHIMNQHLLFHSDGKRYKNYISK